MCINKLTEHQRDVLDRAARHANILGGLVFGTTGVSVAWQSSDDDGYNWALHARPEEGTAHGHCGYGSDQTWRSGNGWIEIDARTCGGHWIRLRLVEGGGATVEADGLWSGTNWADCGEYRRTERDYGDCSDQERAASRGSYLLTGNRG